MGSANTGPNGVAVITIGGRPALPPSIEVQAYGIDQQGTIYLSNARVRASLLEFADDDGDSVLNGDEARLGTNPLDPDTDGGFVPDGSEIQQGLDPNDASDDSAGGRCSGTLFNAGNGMGCWYTGLRLGESCDTICASHGGFDAIASQHSGNAVGSRFWPLKAFGSDWVSVECSSTDNNTNWGANNTLPDAFFTHPACFLNCACNN
jgi:hypothetical protein